jgi:hypothetical protein
MLGLIVALICCGNWCPLAPKKANPDCETLNISLALTAQHNAASLSDANSAHFAVGSFVALY